MRRRLYEILEKSAIGDCFCRFYNTFMIIVIIISLIPLAFKEDHYALNIMDQATMIVFLVDYALRWITADYKFKQKYPIAFIKYPFSPMAIIDLLSILPSLLFVCKSFKVLRIFRMMRSMRVLRVFRGVRYSKNFIIMVNVIKKSKNSLFAVLTLTVVYVVVSALVIFNVEPDTFDTFFDAIYWATVSLTTVGYGDIYPVTITGRIIAMASTILGIAIIALPSGVITAGYMNEIQKHDKAN